MASKREDNDSIEQWTSAVNNYSSQYDTTWGACTIIGPPRVYPRYGDIQGAWAPKASRSQLEFVELEFAEKIAIQEIDIYETYHAGAVVRVSVRAPGGEWQDVYTNSSPRNITQSRVFRPEIQTTSFLTNEVKITIDCRTANDWCEIDAVMIKGRKFLIAPPPSLDTLAANLSELVNNDLFADVVFQVEGKSCRAHKAILAVRSDYFKAMFCNGLKESKNQKFESISIPDVSYEAFISMMQYIYTNNIKSDITDRAITELIRVADRFSLDGLQQLCNYKICTSITADNVITIYREASEKLPVLEDVQNSCIEYMGRNLKQISNSKQFEKLPQQVMLEIIQKATQSLSLK